MSQLKIICLLCSFTSTVPPHRPERRRRHLGKSGHAIPHGGKRPRGFSGVPFGLRTPPPALLPPGIAPSHPAAASPYRTPVPKGKSRTRAAPRCGCPERQSPAQTSPSSPRAAGARQNRLPSQPPPSFIRTGRKSVLFPHKPKIILVLSTRISSLIITRVLCDTKSFPAAGLSATRRRSEGRSVLPLPGRKAGGGSGRRAALTGL